MSLRVSKFLLKGVRKIMLANQENSDKKILTIVVVSLVVTK